MWILSQEILSKTRRAWQATTDDMRWRKSERDIVEKNGTRANEQQEGGIQDAEAIIIELNDRWGGNQWNKIVFKIAKETRGILKPIHLNDDKKSFKKPVNNMWSKHIDMENYIEKKNSQLRDKTDETKSRLVLISLRFT